MLDRLSYIIETVDDIKDNDLHFTWHNVSIREYDAERQRWRVSPDDREHNVFDMYRPEKQNQKQESLEDKRRSADHSITNGKLNRDGTFLSPIFLYRS